MHSRIKLKQFTITKESASYFMFVIFNFKNFKYFFLVKMHTSTALRTSYVGHCKGGARLSAAQGRP